MPCKLLDQPIPQLGGISTLFLIGGDEDSALAVMADFDTLFSSTDSYLSDISDTDHRTVVRSDRKIAYFFEIAKGAASLDVEPARATSDCASWHVRTADADGVDDNARGQTQFSQSAGIDRDADFGLWQPIYFRLPDLFVPAQGFADIAGIFLHPVPACAFTQQSNLEY